MNNAKSRAAKVKEHTSRFNRFLYEMSDLKAAWEMLQKETEGNLDPIIIECLERRNESIDFTKKQITADTHKWALKMKKDQLLLEEVIGKCDQNYYWMFDGLGIQWQTERYWQGHEDQDEYEEVNEGFSDEYEEVNGGEEGDTRWIFGNDEYPD